MEFGAWLTRLSIWAALGGYAISVGTLLLFPGCGRRLARWVWTAGLVFFLMHVAAAFHYYYDWSHAVGLKETARQTRELTGLDSSQGLYLNYLFTGVWLVDTGYWWGAGLNRYASRPLWIVGLVHGFFIFMIVNGAVVFVEGHARWLGSALLAGVVGAWLMRRKERRG